MKDTSFEAGGYEAQPLPIHFTNELEVSAGPDDLDASHRLRGMAKLPSGRLHR